MKLAIVGLSQVGKTRVFGALTGRDMSAVPYSHEPVSAIVSVHDERLDFIHTHFPESKKIRANFELVDFGPAPGREHARSEVLKEAELFGMMRVTDGLLVVLRAFESRNVQPALGKVDPLAEWDELRATFMLNDAAAVENKMKALRKLVKRGLKSGSPVVDELALLERVRVHLDELKPLGELELTGSQKKMLSNYHFLSMKPCLVLLNVGEGDLGQEHPAEAEIAGHNLVEKISAQVEMELAQLNDEDRAVFMEELGVGTLMADRVIAEAYKALGLISFFTIGSDEVRAWRIRRGMTAPQAAGKIHTDFERGFIRAEVFSIKDFRETPSEKELRAKGKGRLEGKEYLVKDGDLIDFRFNV